MFIRYDCSNFCFFLFSLFFFYSAYQFSLCIGFGARVWATRAWKCLMIVARGNNNNVFHSILSGYTFPKVRYMANTIIAIFPCFSLSFMQTSNHCHLIGCVRWFSYSPSMLVTNSHSANMIYEIACTKITFCKCNNDNANERHHHQIQYDKRNDAQIKTQFEF